MKGYRIGWPLWRVAARAGITIEFRVFVHFDEESKTFWADSPDIDGLVAAGDTIPELQKATYEMAADLLELEMSSKKHVHARPRFGLEDNVVHA